MAWAISRSYSFFPGIFHVYMKYMLINFFFFSCYSFITRGGGDSANNSEGLLLLLLFSHSVVFNSLWPHGLQHTRLPSPSPSPRLCSNLCPLSWWCHPTISSSVVPFSSCLQSLPASGTFPMRKVERKRMIFPPLQNPALWDHYIIPVTLSPNPYEDTQENFQLNPVYPEDCRLRMLPATSLNRGGCSHQ